ncbi:BTAD domain-containing putative transcriptional regulator, partial [Streptomyces sp. NBRC 110611]|uniref:BTAD domain-containing putative transcriptional regulator n=1 Tax=Streptomyces sp. NBRC 110611 TaxID=1621259 RepID=UPI0009A03F9F
CIGTLVVAALTLWRPHAASAQQPSSASETRLHVTATAPLIPSPGEQAATLRTADATTSPHIASAISGEEYRGPFAGGEAVRLVEYTVREGDTLWDIAHTHLGDALKWPRIYALNKDRVQSDGARLRDPDLIMPGWQLTIPVSHRSTASLPTPTPAGPAPDAAAETPPAPTASAQPPLDQKPGSGRQLDGNQAPAASRHHDDAMDQKTVAGPGPAAIGFGEASLIGITAAAGLLAARRYWYLHQRRLRRPDNETPAPALSPLVDKAAQAAHAAAQPRRAHDPEALITRRTPPQQPRSADTVTIGVEGNVEVPLDVLATVGGCTWTGPGAEGAARALLTGILTAAERQRPRPPHVKAIVTEEIAGCLLPGLPQRFTALTQSTDTAQAVRMAEQHLITHARAHNELDTPASGQAMAHCFDEEGPGTLVLLTRPNAAHIGQVQAVATRSRPGVLIVLTLDAPLPDATHWHIDADGTTTRPHKRTHSASRLELFHLTPDAGRDMTQVLLGAHGQRPNLRILPTQSPPPHDKQPDSEPGPEADADAVDDSEEEPAPSDDPHLTSASRPVQTKPVRLHVLGPVTLYARGHEEPVGTNLRPEVHEFLALLAAYPTGLLISDIADKLHLTPGSEHNALKNLRRAVRRALRAATGITTQEFILRQGELHKLNPRLVETDLADFTQKLKEVSVTGAEHPEKDVTHTVRQVLTHYCGPFAQGGDYLWADAIREHLTTQATDAALRLTHQAEHTPTNPQQRDTALGLLEHLGALHPDHERLTQHAIRLYQASGRHDAARHTYSRLERHLAELGLEPEPATRALLTPRAPSRHTR